MSPHRPRPRLWALSGIALAALASSLLVGSLPASASPVTASSTMPDAVFVGDWVYPDIEFDIPADATADELPTSISFSIASDSDPSTSALQFGLQEITPELSDCVVDPGGTSGSCDWIDAAPGQSETLTLSANVLDSSLGIQHLTFSEQTPSGTVIAGTQDVDVVDSVVSASAVASSSTVAIGGTVSVTTTFTVAQGIPADILPSNVGFSAAIDPYSGSSSLSWSVTSFTGASSCQPYPDTRGIGCQLDDPQPGDVITVTGLATATTTPLGDSPNALGAHYLYFSYGGPNIPAQSGVQLVPTIDVTGSTTPPTGGTGGTGTTGGSHSGGSQSGDACNHSGSRQGQDQQGCDDNDQGGPRSGGGQGDNGRVAR